MNLNQVMNWGMLKPVYGLWFKQLLETKNWNEPPFPIFVTVPSGYPREVLFRGSSTIMEQPLRVVCLAPSHLRMEMKTVVFRTVFG